jgi:hypothetical protein
MVHHISPCPVENVGHAQLWKGGGRGGFQDVYLDCPNKSGNDNRGDPAMTVGESGGEWYSVHSFPQKLLDMLRELIYSRSASNRRRMHNPVLPRT